METNWHTVVPTTLGRLTLVRDEDAPLGLYFPNHWYAPDPTTFGPRRDVGFAGAVGQRGEYLAGRRKEFDVQPAPRGSEFLELEQQRGPLTLTTGAGMHRPGSHGPGARGVCAP